MLTYIEAKKTMDKSPKRDTRKLAGNTILFKLSETAYAIKFHQTVIITINSDGTYILNSGGWNTVTTKARLNRFSPARLFQENFIWYLYCSDFSKGARYFDGMVIDTCGKSVVTK